LIKKDITKFQWDFCKIFCSLKPWIQIRNQIRIHLKGLIRILIQLIRIGSSTLLFGPPLELALSPRPHPISYSGCQPILSSIHSSRNVADRDSACLGVETIADMTAEQCLGSDPKWIGIQADKGSGSGLEMRNDPQKISCFEVLDVLF
jgi:hypothetical protein